MARIAYNHRAGDLSPNKHILARRMFCMLRKTETNALGPTNPEVPVQTYVHVWHVPYDKIDECH